MKEKLASVLKFYKHVELLSLGGVLVIALSIILDAMEII